MWRKYHEDWERRKSYLIRSLFQDIPVLSPVPEDSESRCASPSDLPPPRPHSPLPPLIIERMPNRHDHPEQFYRDLERKMRKLYKKLFYSTGSSSADELMKTFESNTTYENLLGQLEDLEGDHIEGDDAADSDYEHLSERSLPHHKTHSHNRGTSENETSSQKHDGDTATTTHESSHHSVENSVRDTQHSQDFESSTRSLFATQVTIVADVHRSCEKGTGHNVERSAEEDNTIVLSPILDLKRVHSRKAFLSHDADEETNGSTENDQSVEEEEKMVRNSKLNETENSVSGIELEEKDVYGKSEATNESIELMRRQRRASFSLGSQFQNPFDTDNSELSVTYTDIEFQKKISPENNGQDESTETEIYNWRESIARDFVEVPHGSSFSQASKRGSSSSRAESLEIASKRKRFGNIAVQTSVSSEFENLNNWDRLKKSFFIGVPKIYKLCSCNNHSCNRNC